MSKNVIIEKYFDYKTIETFEDACKKLCISPTSLPYVREMPLYLQDFITNIAKLSIIFQAINNGWKADFTNNQQRKYYPWFEIGIENTPSGFGFSHTAYDCANTYTAVGARLCCNSKEKALYIANTFQTEYLKILL